MEYIASFFSLLAVFLTIRQNIWTFPVGLVGLVAYGYVFAQQGWYGNVVLQAIFAAQNLYGWYHWSSGRVGERELPVTRLKWLDRVWWLMVVGMVVPATAWLLQRLVAFGWAQPYAVKELAFADAFTLTVSLLAQWLVARKRVENWPLWIIANVVYVAMFLYSQAWISAATYVVFAGMAYWGWQEWKPLISNPPKKRRWF